MIAQQQAIAQQLATMQQQLEAQQLEAQRLAEMNRLAAIEAERVAAAQHLQHLLNLPRKTQISKADYDILPPTRKTAKVLERGPYKGHMYYRTK